MVVKRNFGYVDLSFNPSITNLGDISVVENKNSIKQSLFNIIKTNKGQRVMESNFGASIERFLFEPLDNETGLNIGRAIKSNIEAYEPRITLKEINVVAQPSKDGYKVEIMYYINNLQETDSISLTLEKM
jgi:phage baseplate assembly protein W